MPVPAARPEPNCPSEMVSVIDTTAGEALATMARTSGVPPGDGTAGVVGMVAAVLAAAVGVEDERW